jgi:hypothetical protein
MDSGDRSKFPVQPEKGTMRKHPILAALMLGFLAGCAQPPPAPPDPLTEVEIIQMVKDGMPPGDIISAIRSSGTVYIIDSKDIVRLHQAGVPDEVIDYMLKTRVWDMENRARVQPYHYHHHHHPYCWDPYCHGPHWHGSFGWSYWW